MVTNPGVPSRWALVLPSIAPTTRHERRGTKVTALNKLEIHYNHIYKYERSGPQFAVLLPSNLASSLISLFATLSSVSSLSLRTSTTVLRSTIIPTFLDEKFTETHENGNGVGSLEVGVDDDSGGATMLITPARIP